MLTNLKALVVVLAVAWAVFWLVRPLCLQYMSAEAFASRRNVWFALTIVAFVSPNFWIYAIFSIALLGWSGAKEENPLALYVLVTFAIPNASFYIPTMLIGQLFDLTQYRILSLAILLPWMVRLWNDPARAAHGRLRLADTILIAFLLLQMVLTMPYESGTTTMRRAFLLTIDVFVVFYAFSRLVRLDRTTEVMACFWLACAVMAPLAIFEWGKGWLLYTGLSALWGDPNVFSWLLRGGSLRSQVSAGHSINLGYQLAVGLGFFLYLRSRSRSAAMAWLVTGTFAVAIYTTGSRGAWLTAALAAVFFVLFRPGAVRRLAGAVALGAVIVAVMYVTPFKESVLDRLPLIGTVDQDTVDYRQQLAEVSWTIIRQNPFFGNPFAATQMESLRQGQGIIDIVNGYVFTALFNGFVGLFLVVAVWLVALGRGSVAMLRARAVDSDAGQAGAALVAVFLASLFYIATAGYGTTTYIIAGLLVSYATAMSWPSVAPAQSRPVHAPGLAQQRGTVAAARRS